MAETIKGSEFTKLVQAADLPLLIDVFGENCPPCKIISPVIDQMAETLKGEAKIVKMDRDASFRDGGENNALITFIRERDVRGVPAFLLFDQGKFKAFFVGGPPSASEAVHWPSFLQSWMESHLGRKFAAQPKKAEAAASKLRM